MKRNLRQILQFINHFPLDKYINLNSINENWDEKKKKLLKQIVEIIFHLCESII